MRLSLTLALAGLLALTVVRLWLMPLPSSLWMDEANTAFVIQYGPAHPSLAIFPPLAPIYWMLPGILLSMFGFSEIALRLPSVLAMAAALWLISRLAARLIHPQAAWLAIFACLALRGFDFQASDARPYALGTAIMAAALWCLVRWLDKSRWHDAALFVIFAALLLRVHPVYFAFYGVFVAYAVARLAWKETGVTWWQAGAVFAALGLALLPAIFGVLAMRGDAAAHVISPPPGLRELFYSLQPGLLIECGVGAWLLTLLARWTSQGAEVSRSSLLLIALWWLVDPLSLFACSHLTGVGMFVPRYYSLALPGAALVATVLIVRLVPGTRWKLIAAGLGVGVLLVSGEWGERWPVHANADWRGAARAINQVAVADLTPVLCTSPFVESRSPVWRPNLSLPAVLYSPLAVYPVHGRMYLLPFQESPDAEQFASGLSQTVLSASGSFILYGHRTSEAFWEHWFERRPELTGWTSRRLGAFGDVMAVEFAKR